jgi:flagellar hook-length control protein FliK
MTQTNLDFLFQVTAPVGERQSYGLSRGDELRSDFGNHLKQASSTTHDTGSTPTSAGDARAGLEPSTNDLESQSAGVAGNRTASTHELADSGSNDSGADTSPGVNENNGNDTAASATTDADGSSRGSDQTASTDGSSDASETSDQEEEHDTDDKADADAALLAAESANRRAAVIAPSAEIGSSKSPGNGGEEESVNGTATKGAASESGISAKSALTESGAGDAPIEAEARTAIASTKAPTEQGESVAASVSPITNKKLQPAKPKTVNQTEIPGQGNAQRGPQVGIPSQEIDASPRNGGEKTEMVAASADLSLSESANAEAEVKSPDGRDSNAQSSTRQQADAAALAGKFATAAVSNSVGPQPANSASPRETNDGASRAANGSAKVAAVGNGAHGLRAHAGASKRGNRVDSGEETPRIDPARFIGRVSKAFHTAQERGGTLQIRLNPPELGAMRLELTVKDGVMTAALETETASARRVLLEHLPALRDRLTEQNIRVERFDVDVRREGTGSQADPRGTQDQQQPNREHAEPRRLQTRIPPIAEKARQIKPIVTAQGGDTGINLVA